MFCAHCGYLNDDNAHRCISCEHVMLRPGESITGEIGYPAKAHLAVAIVVTLLCCQITGIVAIVYASFTMSHNGEGKYAEAQRTSKAALVWIWISFGIGLAIVAFYVIAGVLTAAGTLP